jgi:MoxR-like ATPase
VEVKLDLSGVPCFISDTAGLRSDSLDPIEQEGTYPLPEAQVDRFLMKLVVGYPTREEEREILFRATRPPEAPERCHGPH